MDAVSIGDQEVPGVFAGFQYVVVGVPDLRTQPVLSQKVPDVFSIDISSGEYGGISRPMEIYLQAAEKLVFRPLLRCVTKTAVDFSRFPVDPWGLVARAEVQRPVG
jgi:hypothetical protein